MGIIRARLRKEIEASQLNGLLRSVQLWFHNAPCIRETFDIFNDVTSLQTFSSDEENKDETGKWALTLYAYFHPGICTH